jgi:chromosome segregation ATPase
MRGNEAYGGSGRMGLEERLNQVLRRQFAVLEELRRAQSEVAVTRSRLQMRIADLERQREHALEQYEQAVAEQDAQAELIRELPERATARIEELNAAVADLEATEERVQERIRAAEQDIDDFRVLQPQLVARVAAARNAGLGREIFDTLNDALNYVELALDMGKAEDPNGPVRSPKP